MEKLKNITIILLLAIGLFTSVAPAKTVGVLLQEGLYAEEIEGDLDAAIKIYEQVISKSKETQQAAVHATYRIGMCYMKKGEKAKAAEYFQNIISDFPDQRAFARKAEKQLDKIKPRAERIVEQAVMTISTCAEGDPRVTEALESLKGLDENAVVSELGKFLGSETDTVRRSAIYILWKGDLKDISSAVPALEKLCSHEEEFTRGMAALALGQAKVNSSFDTLCDMTLKDNSGYARRCGAIALGWMGRADARPTLEKATKDSDPLVQINAKAALAMLSKAAEAFPEFVGCRIKETLEMKFTKPDEEWWLKDPTTTKTIYENTHLEIEWEIDRIISDKSEVFAISVLPEGIDIHDYDSFMWFETDIPVSARKTKYGYSWKGVADKIGTFRKAKRLVTGEYKVFLYAFGNLTSDRGWQKLLKDNIKGVATAKLNVKPMPYTQISINDIGADGTIRFKNILQEINQQGVQITTRSFINSDFVQVKNMFDDEGRPIEFTATHQGDIYRYNLAFSKPVSPGEAMLYGSEGTITGLIHPVRETQDVFRYFMVHSPGTNRPTRRIETYSLPEGAELISTTPKDMAHRIKDGRIELYVEKMIPAGGNIATAFQYRHKMLQQQPPDIETLIKEMHEPEKQRFAALNKLIKIGAPAVEPLISELQKSNNWQVPKALGAIGDKRAIEPLIKKWQKCDWTPMKEVISEALERITGENLGQEKQKWDKWWQETKCFISPEATIRNFMAAAIKLDMNNAMVYVAGDSHDYKDIKAIFENPEHPFNVLFRKTDPAVPVKIIETKITDNMCEAVWQITFKEDFTIKGKTFKAKETFDIDGNLHRYEDKWLITGI